MPASWRTSDLTILSVAAAGTVLLTAASFFAAPSDSLPRHDGSSFAVHRDGGKAAYVLLKELGYRIDRSFEPLASLRVAPPESALVLASPLRAPSDQDVRALRRFLDDGGLVLATGTVAAAFLPGVPAQRAASPRPRRQSAQLPSALSGGVEEMDMAPSTAPLSLESRYVVIYGSAEEPAVLSARVGKGRALWWSGSTPLTNGGLGSPGHVELLINALGPPESRTIVWDEFYHGHTRSFWSYVADTPLPVAGLQFGALAAAAFFTYSRRRRPIRPRVVEPRTSPLEFIETMGGLYERARAANAAVATVYAGVRRRLLSAASLPVSTPDDRLIAAASERLALDAAELSALVSSARAASIDPDLTSRQAVEIVAALQGLANSFSCGDRART